MKDKSEHAWKTFELINMWIKFSDTKAGAILAADGVMVGIALNLIPNQFNIENAPKIYIILLFLGLLTGTSSLYFSLKCLVPNLKMGKSKSIIYFSHIAQNYESPKDYLKSFNRHVSNEETFIDQITDQIWTNSIVSQQKYMAVTWSTRLFAITVFIIIISIITSWLV